ncbi:MAG: hypothetical protein ACR5LB_01535 [Wolbachia sp.]
MANKLGLNNKNNRIIVDLFLNQDPSVTHWGGVSGLFIIIHD